MILLLFAMFTEILGTPVVVMDMNCEPCPSGSFVVSYCNSTSPSKCQRCPDDFFSAKPNNNTFCSRCQRCKRREIVARRCTATKNTKCDCGDNEIYHPHKPCRPCPTGLKKYNNVCTNATINDSGVGKEIDYPVIIGMIVGFSLALIIIIVVAVYLSKRVVKRRKKKEAPDIIKEAEAQKTPPLPPKTRSRGNEYGPMPSLGKPLTTHKLTSKNLPFSLVQELTILLSSRYSKNYKHLAGELGYNFAFVLNLESQPQPVETLLDYFVAGRDATKERLYEALIRIDRPDVADIIWYTL